MFSLLIPLLLLASCPVNEANRDEVERLTRELETCKTQLTDQSYLGQVCSRVSGWAKKDTQLKSGMEKMLKHLDLMTGALQTDDKPIEKDLVMTLTQQDLRKLREFVMVDQSSASEVEDILVRSIKVKQPWLDMSGILPGMGHSGTHFKANYVILVQVLVLLCCIVIPLLLGAKPWQILIFLMFYAVLQTWVQLYYKACAKKQATLAKHATAATASCLLEKQGWLAATKDFIGGLFNGVEDPCEAYYTAAMVDPAFEVGPLIAIVETFTVCLVVPGKACGEGLGSFYTQLLHPLPYVWKIPVLILATLVLLFLLLLLCGYEFKIPFLLSVRPSKRRKNSSTGTWIGGGGGGGETRPLEQSPPLHLQGGNMSDHGPWTIPDTRPRHRHNHQD